MEVEPISKYPQDQKRQDELIITAVVMASLCGVIILLRIFSRFYLIRNPGADDWFIIGSMALTTAYVVLLFIARDNHLGFPMSTLTLDNMINFMKVTIAIQVLYYVNVFCIKTSILATYLRIAVSQHFRRAVYGTICFHVLFLIVCVVVTLAQCVPLEKMWDFAGLVEGKCVDSTAFFYFTSSVNIFTDIVILVLPIKTLKSIQRPRRERIALFFIFGVGLIATISSIIRLHTIYTYTLATDPFREGILVNLWSIIEVTVAITCASVPGLKPLFSWQQVAASRAAKSSATGSAGLSAGNHYYSGKGSTTVNSTKGAYYGDHVRLNSLDDGSRSIELGDRREGASHTSIHGADDQRELVGKPCDIGVRTDVTVTVSAPERAATGRRSETGMATGGEMY